MPSASPLGHGPQGIFSRIENWCLAVGINLLSSGVSFLASGLWLRRAG